MGLKREDCERLFASSVAMPRKATIKDELGKQWQWRYSISGIFYSLQEQCQAILEQLSGQAVAVRVYTRNRLSLDKEKTAETGKEVYNMAKFEFQRGLSAMDAVAMIAQYAEFDAAPIIASYQAKLVKAQEEENAKKEAERKAKEEADKLASEQAEKEAAEKAQADAAKSQPPVDIGTPSTDNGEPSTPPVNRTRGRKPQTVN